MGYKNFRLRSSLNLEYRYTTSIPISTKIGILLLLLITSSIPKAYSLALGPLLLEKPTGKLKVINTQKRFRKIIFTAYPVKYTKEEGPTLVTSGFDQEEMDESVTFSPKVARLSGEASKMISYSIKKEGSYYLCAESSASPRFKFRVCSLYESES